MCALCVPSIASAPPPLPLCPPSPPPPRPPSLAPRPPGTPVRRAACDVVCPRPSVRFRTGEFRVGGQVGEAKCSSRSSNSSAGLVRVPQAAPVLWPAEVPFRTLFLCSVQPLRTSPRDHEPPTAARRPPPTATYRQSPSANRHQPPTGSRQPPPTTNRRQPPTVANRQPPPTANRHPPTATNHQPSPTANRCPILLLWPCV